MNYYSTPWIFKVSANELFIVFSTTYKFHKLAQNLQGNLLKGGEKGE